MSAFTPIRDSAGGIVGMQPKEEGSVFAEMLQETMDAVGATEPEKDETPAPRRLGRLEMAGIVGGLVLAVAAIAALNVFTPARAPRSVPTAMPAGTSAPTRTPTQAPTATATATLTPEPPTAVPPPTQEVIYVEVPPACDPFTNPRYVVAIDLSPIGSVRGVSCVSQEEATANANQLAADMRATAEAR